jgi:hypothetical protein
MKKLYSWDEINCEIVEMTASEMRAANEQTGWEFGKRYKNGVRLDNGGPKARARLQPNSRSTPHTGT